VSFRSCSLELAVSIFNAYRYDGWAFFAGLRCVMGLDGLKPVSCAHYLQALLCTFLPFPVAALKKMSELSSAESSQLLDDFASYSAVMYMPV
jgi:hypothetical protein